MTQETSTSPLVGKVKKFLAAARARARAAADPVYTVFGYAVTLFAPLMLFWGVTDRRRVSAAADLDAGALAVIIIFGGVSTFVFVLGARQLRVLPRRRVRLALETALVGGAAVCYLIVGLSRLAIAYGAWGGSISIEPRQPDLLAGSVHAKFVWESLKSIPLLDVPRTLGWSDPMPRPDAALGWALVAFKLLMIAVIFRFTVVVWRHLSNTARGTDTSA
jgi:hypothetical protein